jgi:3-deoxy-D-manno-octulosonic acid (KDO) 8-phosphate synthase
VDDLIDLKVLPASTDRAQVLPVMQRVIGPYVFQGTQAARQAGREGGREGGRKGLLRDGRV